MKHCLQSIPDGSEQAVHPTCGAWERLQQSAKPWRGLLRQCSSVSCKFLLLHSNMSEPRSSLPVIKSFPLHRERITMHLWVRSWLLFCKWKYLRNCTCFKVVPMEITSVVLQSVEGTQTELQVTTGEYLRPVLLNSSLCANVVLKVRTAIKGFF